MLILTDQARNIEAIAVYISGTVPLTSAAAQLRDQWQAFYSSLGDVERNYEQQAYDRARNLRLAFNRANAVTPADKAAVEAQALGGLTTEEVDGNADRRTGDGSFIPPPSGSTQLAVIGVGVALGLVLLLRR